MKKCNTCGTQLIESGDKKLCPNCGLVSEEEPIENAERNYIG